MENKQNKIEPPSFLKASSIKKEKIVLKKKTKQPKAIFFEKYAELFNGTLVKITHEYNNDMFIGDVLSEYSEKCIGTMYFPKSYVKSFEEISVK